MNLLRIEGVNIYATVTDTDDLSTRRGSSLLLLTAIQQVAARFRGQLQAISTGASVGLFQVKDNAPLDLADQVRAYLAGQSPDADRRYRHMTFVVDMVQASGFRAATEAALAANRWRQMGSFSLSLADLGLTSPQACAYEGTRPANPSLSPPKAKATPGTRLSPSAFERADLGRTQRQGFYRRELAALGGPSVAACAADDTTGATLRLEPLSNLDFTDSLQDLAGGLDPIWGYSSNLRDKVAVFYADGNRFGSIASACPDERALSAWDTRLKTLRRAWLARLLEVARTSRRWQTRADQVRLETLLWGGDEFMLVVPAWCGLELAQHFIADSAGWTHQGKPLTHACGLVFCHAKAPIGPITQLAQNLAELGKSDHQRHLTTLHTLVLESFDQAGGNLDALLATRYRARLTSWADLTLTPDRLSALITHLPGLKAVLPRATLTRALRLMLRDHDDATTTHPLLVRSYANVQRAVAQAPHDQAFAALWQSLTDTPWPQAAPTPLGSPATADSAAADAANPNPLGAARHLAAWAQMLELWDYVRTAPTTDQTEPASVPTSQPESAA